MTAVTYPLSLGRDIRRLKELEQKVKVIQIRSRKYIVEFYCLLTEEEIDEIQRTAKILVMDLSVHKAELRERMAMYEKIAELTEELQLQNKENDRMKRLIEEMDNGTTETHKPSQEHISEPAR